MENNSTCCILTTNNFKLLKNIPHYHDLDFIVSEGGCLLAIKECLNIVAGFSDLDTVSISKHEKIFKSLENFQLLKKEKKFSDGEHCVREAFQRGYKNIIIVAENQRIDHLFVQLLFFSKYDLNIKVILPNNQITKLRIGKNIITNSYKYCSFFCLGNQHDVVSSENLKWELDNLALDSSTTHTISNTIIGSFAIVHSEQGNAFCIQSDE